MLVGSPVQPKDEGPKKVLFGQAIFVTFFWAFANFMYGRLDNQDFSTQCLQFTGYLTVCLAYKFISISKLDKVSCRSALFVFFS